MKITKEMVDLKFYEELGILDKPEELQEGGIGKGGISQYMEYPTGNRRFVIQDHWRGRSVHLDFRMEMNDHLTGWTILDNPPNSPEVVTVEEARKALKTLDWKFSWKKQNVGLRAETKARQPKEWIKIQGIVKPGDPGATKDKPGVFLIKERGKFWEGAQKPYFHEYFLKGTTGYLPKDRWVRVIMRGIRVAKIDPETKKPKPGQYEMMWRCMIPAEQTAYSLKRGLKKKWKPPKGVIPIPPDQRKGELWEKWQAFMKGKITPKKEKEEKEDLAPFGVYKSFADCVAKNQDKRDPKAYCAVVRRKIRKEETAKSLEQLPFAGFKDFADCVRKCEKEGRVTDCKAWCAVIRRKIEGSYCEDCLRYEACSSYALPDQLACSDFEPRKEILVKGKFTLHLNSYMGQVVVRAVPHIEYYLRLQYGGKTRSWFLDANPIRRKEMAAVYEGTVKSKWMTFEGKIKPGQTYNPTKTLIAQMVIVDKGSVNVETREENGKNIIQLSPKGKQLKGNWILEQEEKRSDIFVFKRTAEKEKLVAGEFVLHRHYWGKKQHWDIRIKISEKPDKLIEWNLWKNPLKVGMEEPIPTLVKTCDDPEKWFIKRGKGIPRKVFGKQTYVDVLDSGKLNLIEYTGGFLSMKFAGEKLKGYWILKRDPQGKWYFEKAKLPEAHSLAGKPLEGDYYKPFLREQKKGWDYYWVRIYDIQRFTRCVKDWKKYLPNLKLPNYIEDVLVCLHRKPGTFHQARVCAVKVKGAETDFSQVCSWIRKNKLHTWTVPIIKEKREKPF